MQLISNRPMFATVHKGNIIKFNNRLRILRRDTAQTRLRAVFLLLGKKVGTTSPGPDDKGRPFFHAKIQEVNVYARCPRSGKIRKTEFEEFIFNAMRTRFSHAQIPTPKFLLDWVKPP